VPLRNIARLLNNESNLRILEKLKEKPYYPRELAAAMNVSEPFVVRRLRAMEECGIVEGAWETEGSRKVKRYYLKDINIRLGKGGLEVKIEDVPAKRQINVKNELLGTAIRLPLIIMLLIGVFTGNQPIIAAICLYFIWNAAIGYAFYRRFSLKTPLFSLAINLAIALLLAAMLAHDVLAGMPQEMLAIIMAAALVLVLLALVYRSRFYQLEVGELFESMDILMEKLKDEPVYVKAFYLPSVIRWKANEYFGLI
jgi:DNA-binding transcriptional ArsR family regulator